MRCHIQNCKTKLTKGNRYIIQGYDEEELETNDVMKISKAVKIHICKDCARTYLGKYFKEDGSYIEFIGNMEFKDEFCKDIFEKLK